MSIISSSGRAKSHWKKAVKLTIALFLSGFNSSKCKTAAKLAVARIKLLRNKRQVVVKQMRRDIALLLQSGQDATARVRVEHVMREQNIMAANEFIELFCELIVQRLSIIAKQRECPADLKEGISSLIFAAPRCSEIPELSALRDIFEKKYGKDFVGAATDLRPDCGVNRMLIDKLSVRTPAGEVKLKVLKEIAKEYQVEWDTTESEMELLKPPEKLIEGPRTFVSASSMPVKPTNEPIVQPNNPPPRRYSGNSENNFMHFHDTKSAAEAAAEAASAAVAAAEAAAFLANRDSNGSNNINGSRNATNFDTISSSPTINIQTSSHASERSPGSPNNANFHRRHSYNQSGVKFDESDHDDDRKKYRRHTYNAPPPKSTVEFDRSTVKFDDSESDCDEEIEMERGPLTGNNGGPPNRPPPPAPPAGHTHLVHPKLPDYDTLAARFEALKNHKSQT